MCVSGAPLIVTAIPAEPSGTRVGVDAGASAGTRNRLGLALSASLQSHLLLRRRFRRGALKPMGPSHQKDPGLAKTLETAESEWRRDLIRAGYEFAAR